MATWAEVGDAGPNTSTANDITDGILAYPVITGLHFTGDSGDMFLVYGEGILSIDVYITGITAFGGPPGSSKINFTFGNDLDGQTDLVQSEDITTSTGLTVAGGNNFTTLHMEVAAPLVSVNPDYDPEVPFPYYVYIHWNYGGFNYTINLNLSNGGNILIRHDTVIQTAFEQQEIILDPGRPYIPEHYIEVTTRHTEVVQIDPSASLVWVPPNPLIPGDPGSWQHQPISNIGVINGTLVSIISSTIVTNLVLIPEQSYIAPKLIPAVAAKFVSIPAIGWNAGASSLNSYFGSIEYSFVINRSPACIITGLSPIRVFSEPLQAPAIEKITHAFLIDHLTYRIIESKQIQTPPAGFALGTTFKVRRAGLNVQYLVNNVIVYESKVLSAIDNVLIDAVMYNDLDQIDDASVSPCTVGMHMQGTLARTYGVMNVDLHNVMQGRSKRTYGNMEQVQTIQMIGVSPRSAGKGWVGFGNTCHMDMQGTNRLTEGEMTIGSIGPAQFIQMKGLSLPTVGYMHLTINPVITMTGTSRKTVGKAWLGFNGMVHMDMQGSSSKTHGLATRHGVLYKPTCPLAVKILQTYKPVAPISVNITGNVYKPIAPLSISITGTYKPVAPVAIEIFNDRVKRVSANVVPGIAYDPEGPPDIIDTSKFWGLRVILDGIDVTSHIFLDTVEITFEEDAATIAELSIMPYATTENLLTWAGNKSITIDYRPPGEETWYRRFTGIVDTPQVDLITHVTKLLCTDGLQLMFEGQPAEGVRRVVGGDWSPFVFDTNAAGWDSFHDLMSTQTASYNLDSSGIGVKASWIAKDVPDFIFDEDSVIDGSAHSEIAHARDVINSVDIKFDYQFTRLYEYRIGLGWVMPSDAFLLYGKIPNHEAIVQAITGAGYAFHAFRGLPVTNVWNPVCVPTLSSQGSKEGISASLPMLIYEPKKYLDTYNWSIQGLNLIPTVGNATIDGVVYLGDIPRFSQVGSFDARVIKRFSQPITESYMTVITCPDSIRQVGRNSRKYNHAVQVDYTGDRITNQWEELVPQDIDYKVSEDGHAINGGFFNALEGNQIVTNVHLTVNRYAVGYPHEPPDDNVLAFDSPYMPMHWDRDKSPLDGRTAMQEAFSVVHNRVIKEIMNSHRGSAIVFDTLLHPTIELFHTVQLTLGYGSNTLLPKFRAKGKVSKLVHRFNPQTGEATTEVTVALIKNFGSGIQYSAPLIDLPEQLQWGQCPHVPRVYTLDSWPSAVADLTNPYFQGDITPKNFRGWNFFTGEMVIESPTLPPEAYFNAIKIITNTMQLSLPDDQFEIEDPT